MPQCSGPAALIHRPLETALLLILTERIRGSARHEREKREGDVVEVFTGGPHTPRESKCAHRGVGRFASIS